jgi:molybdenum cofactor cytidylyltransferase
MKNDRIGAIILAGGKSSRMKFPKPWLSYDDDKLFLEHIIDVYKRAGISNVVIVLNHSYCTGKWLKYFKLIENDAIVTQNPQPDLGRIHSIKLGIRSLKKPFAFIQNVDNPFVKTDVIEMLRNNANLHGTTIPTHLGKGGHPILINDSVQLEILKSPEKERNLRTIISKFPNQRIEVKDSALLKNINTPEEYKQVMNGLV